MTKEARSRCETGLDLTIVFSQKLSTENYNTAYGKGGALDSIIPDETGLFFEQQNTDSLIATLNSFETTGDTAWNVDRLKAHAQGFSGVLFHERMGAYIRRVIEDTN